jgi:phage tail sheath protein FI
MADKTFLSPAVSTREIDLSQPTKISPSGVPAGVIGTARRGPAFVPVTVATFQDFISKFGNTDGEAFGPLAMNEWMKHANAGTYLRVLGIGNAKARTSAGKVTNAGFVVGSANVQDNGSLGINEKAYTGMQLGRSYVLGCFMSQSAGSTIFSDSGLHDHHKSARPQSIPIVRGILFAASGVVPTLKTSTTTNNEPLASALTEGHDDDPQLTAARGLAVGDIMTGSGEKAEFVMLLNGFRVSDAYNNVLTASFDPNAPNNFKNVFNTDPTKIEDAGHYLYQDWQVKPSFATITGSGHTPFADHAVHDGTGEGGKKWATAFLVPSSGSRNTSTAASSTAVGIPNLEGFEDRFRTAFSPFVVSQKFGGKNENLFKLHALDDGQAGSDTFKVTISNIQASNNKNRKHGSFDLSIRRFDDSDRDQVVLEKYNKIDLDPSSDRYIARVIGDTYTYYDFDKKAGGQKLVIDGKYSNISQYVRVETSDKLDQGSIDDSALPVGFRGLHHMVTSGSSTAPSVSSVSLGSTPLYCGILSGTNSTATVLPLTGVGITEASGYASAYKGSRFWAGEPFLHINQLPVPFRENVAVGTGRRKRPDNSLTWGIQFEEKKSPTEPNKLNKLDESLRSFVRYLPRHLTSNQNVVVGDNEGNSDVAGSILDADRYNNNFFSLEQIEVVTASNGKPDTNQWSTAVYRRRGSANGTLPDAFGGSDDLESRFIDPGKDFTHLPTRKYLKFTFPLQGGFNGSNIFNEDKSKFTDMAVRREMDDADNQGGTAGPTVAGIRKAIDVLEQKSDVDIKLLVTPGHRHEAITDYAMESVERRFDALYVMDVEEKDTIDSFVTGSGGLPTNVSNTAKRFADRNLDSSFAAAYFPDVIITDPATATNVQCPPSVAVLGAMSYNDSVAHPWYAPAGFNRGALSSVIESQVKLNQANLDDLYEVDINPIASFGHTSDIVVFGQKTVLANKSSLDRVNVRRLLIEIRRRVRSVANSLLFEPNRESTLAKFSSLVNPILGQIQAQQGLDRYKVQIDTSTTTQADVENNTIRGKVFLQPTRSVEFIALDFVVTNAGSDI